MHGNLFLILTIEFPDSISPENQAAMAKLLPPALHVPKWSEDDKDIEIHTVTDIDPVQSYNSNKAKKRSGVASKRLFHKGFYGCLQCLQDHRRPL